jgi:hypothetical protein
MFPLPTIPKLTPFTGVNFMHEVDSGDGSGNFITEAGFLYSPRIMLGTVDQTETVSEAGFIYTLKVGIA